MTDRVRGLLLALALVCATGMVFWPGVGGGFLFDDFSTIVDNNALHITSLDWHSLRQAALSFEPGGLGRPLAMLWFGVDHVMGGLDPKGYKIAGIAMHAANAVLVFLLTMRVLALVPGSERKVRRTHQLAAFAVAAAWALHPIQVSTVLYVVQRMETLSLFFVLAALLAYISGRRRQQEGARAWPWFVAVTALVVLGLAAKETAVLFPAYALALELTVLRFDAMRRGVSIAWKSAYAFSVAVAMLVFFLYVLPHFTSADAYLVRDFNASERVLSQLRILPLYLSQIVLPLPPRLTFYYDGFVVSKGLLAPASTLAGAMLLAVLAGLAFFLRRRSPLASLGLLWFFAAHLLTSNVIPLELVFEHRNYFALLGILFVFADLLGRIAPRDGPGIKYAGVGALLIAVAALGGIRSATWGDPLLLATDFAANNPTSARAAHDIGVVYYGMADGNADSPFFHFATVEFEREAALPNSTILGEQSLILMRAAAGLPAKPEWWVGLHDKLRTRPITPATTHGMFALLKNRLDGTRIDDRELLGAFVQMFSRVELPNYSYAEVADYALMTANEPEIARDLYFAAIDVSHDRPAYAELVEKVLTERGHGDLAAEVALHASRPVPPSH